MKTAAAGAPGEHCSDTSSMVKLTSHRVWLDGSGSVGVWSGWSLVLNTDVKYSLNMDAISGGFEAERVGVDTPSLTPIDMVSGILDFLLLSLNTEFFNTEFKYQPKSLWVVTKVRVQRILKISPATP